jgi:hypothetical protein
MSDTGQDNDSKVPVPKVAAATAAAALATVIVVLVSAITGKDAPTGLEGSLATLLAFAAGYLAPPRGS